MSSRKTSALCLAAHPCSFFVPLLLQAEIEMDSTESALGIVFQYSVGDGSVASYYRLSVDNDQGYRRWFE